MRGSGVDFPAGQLVEFLQERKVVIAADRHELDEHRQTGRAQPCVHGVVAVAVAAVVDKTTCLQCRAAHQGYKYLFMGAALALRNTRGHDPSLQTGEQEGMEMLAAASFLMRALERADARLGGGRSNRVMRPGVASSASRA